MVRLIGTGKSKYICIARSIGDTAAIGIANGAVACNVSVTIPVTWTQNRTLLLCWLCGSNWMLCFSKTNQKWNHSSAMITLPFWIWLDQIWKTPDFWSNFLRCQLTGCIYTNCSDSFLQHLLNVAVAACPVSDTRKFNCGLRQLMHVSSSTCRWCITAFITRLSGTWWTTVFRSLMWPVDDISFCQASLPRCASTQSQLVLASGICCCRPNWRELSERWSA